MQIYIRCIKSQTSSNLGQTGPLTTELAALERLKIAHRLIMGKWFLHARSFIFDRIGIKVADNQDRHKSSVEFDFWLNQTLYILARSADMHNILDEFEFRPDRTTDYGVSCP